jgi:D-lyxose ketol-isomerase
MRRSEINRLIQDARAYFEAHGWALPPNPRWDVTDFGLGDWRRFALVLVNLAEEPEYCEKLMYAKKGMATPAHCHRVKKEDIISRWGELKITVWPEHLSSSYGKTGTIKLNGAALAVSAGEEFVLQAGERITLPPGIYHEFEPFSEECIIGEVSTANDDLNDNFFVNPDIGRFPAIEEDEEAMVRLVSEDS